MNKLSEKEFQDLVDRYFPGLAFYALGFGPVPAEDIVQTAFLRLIEQTVHRGSPENIPAWLYQTVRNESIDQLRRLRRGDQIRQSLGQRLAEQESVRLTRGSGAPDGGADSSAISSGDFGYSGGFGSFDASDVLDALDCLSESDREIVQMYIWGGLTFEQIAPVVQASRATVHRRYRAALEQLKKRLNEI